MLGLAPNQLFLTDTIFELLSQLKPDKQPLWGVMSAQHMVEHLFLIPALAIGRIEAPILGTDEQIAKRKVHTFEKQTPLPRDLKISLLSEKPGPLNFDSITDAVASLKELHLEFYRYYAEHPDAMQVHPLLGRLNFLEWDHFIAFHAKHHLVQFGLLED